MAKRVVVAGAGLAGLTAAYALKKQAGAALDVVVLEKGHVLGGKASSMPHKREGKRYDIEHGLHVYFDYPNFDALRAELGATKGLKPNRHRMEMVWGGVIERFRALPLPAPLHLVLTPLQLGLVNSWHFARIYLAAALLREDRLDPVERKRLDELSTAEFARGLGVPQALIDTELFRFFERSAFNWRYPTSAFSMLRAIKLVSQDYRALEVRYIDGPTSDVLITPLVKACEAAGVTIQRFHDVEGFEHDGRRVTAVLAHAERKYPHGAEAGSPHLSNYHTVLPEHGPETASAAATGAAPAEHEHEHEHEHEAEEMLRFEADYVVSAMPPRELVEVLDERLLALPYFQGVAGIEVQPTIAYQVYYDRFVTPPDNEDCLVAVPGPFSAIMDRTRLWSANSDGEGSVLVLVGELGEWKDKTDDEIMAAGDAAIAQYFPLAREAKVVRRFYHRAGHDRFTMTLVGSDAKRPAAQSPLENLAVAGDFTNNPIGIICMEGTVASGIQAANAVLAREGLPVRAVSGLREGRGLLPVLRWCLHATGLFRRVVGYAER